MNNLTKLLFLTLSLFFIFTSCSKNDDEISKTETSTLKAGNAIILSEISPMGFGYFKVTGLAEGQWNAIEIETINPRNSTATFTYKKIGEKMYRLESLNRQIISTGIRYWTIILDLTFDSGMSGNYTLKDTNMQTGVSYTTYGTFIIK